jgi:hypothetical protein
VTLFLAAESRQNRLKEYSRSGRSVSVIEKTRLHEQDKGQKLKNTMRFLIAKTLTSTLLLCPRLFSTDAPMFRGAPQHSGVYNSSAITNFNRVKWKFHTKGMIFSSPAVVGGVVYVGSNDRNLYAVDLSSGTQKWKFATKGRITSSPAVADGVVFFVL